LCEVSFDQRQKVTFCVDLRTATALGCSLA